MHPLWRAAAESCHSKALASKPAIVLADEPTGNLDTATSHDVLGLLRVVAKQYRQTIILITHDQDIAQLADRIVRIEDGRIVKGSGAMIKNNNTRIISRMAKRNLVKRQAEESDYDIRDPAVHLPAVHHSNGREHIL